MKLLYVTSGSASDPLLWSGIVRNCLNALRNAGAEVVVFDEIPFECSFRLRMLHQYRKLVSRKVHFLQIDPTVLKAAARRIEERFIQTDCDAVFCPGTGVPVFAFLPASIPVFTYHDATKLGWVRAYFGMDSLCEQSQRHVELVDRTSLTNSRMTFFSSTWALEEAVSDFDVPRDRLAVVPFGANLTHPPSRSEVEAAIDARPHDYLRLLFLGKDWKRKGGPEALTLARELRRRGIPTELEIVGCLPEGLSEEDRTLVRLHGFIDHSGERGMRQLRDLMMRSHFIVLLSHAEAFGIALCEAAAFGVPAFAANTGGIPTIVTHGVNGWLANHPFSPTSAAATLEHVLRTPGKYRAAALAARDEFETRLNWNAAAGSLLHSMRATLNDRLAHAQEVTPSPSPSHVSSVSLDARAPEAMAKAPLAPAEPCSLPFASRARIPETGLSFSIVIPVYNGGKVFEQCLRSVAAAVRPGDEIIVVADGESDGSWRIAPDFGAKLIQLEKNGGPGRARNVGVRAAANEIIYFVDADVTIRPHALNLIESIFTQDLKLAALIGSYDEAPGQPNFLSQFKNLLHHYVHQRGSTKASTFWGACGAIRREVFLAVGGFAECYTRASIEDIELGYRLTDAGYTIRIVKELQVTHHKRWTPWGLVKTEIFLRGKPWTRLLWRQLWWNGKVETDLNLDSSHRASLLTSAAILHIGIAGVLKPWLLLAIIPLVACFLYLNRLVLRFFYEKRGLKFATAAAFWRFGYDLYSWVGFFFGSTDSARVVVRRLAQFTFSKIDAVALGVAVGAVSGAALFTASAVLLLKNEHPIGPNLALLGQLLPGYEVTWSGAAIGLAEGFVVGYGGGWLFATVRNFSMRIAMGAEKVERAAKRLIKRRFARPGSVTTSL